MKPGIQSIRLRDEETATYVVGCECWDSWRAERDRRMLNAVHTPADIPLVMQMTHRHMAESAKKARKYQDHHSADAADCLATLYQANAIMWRGALKTTGALS